MKYLLFVVSLFIIVITPFYGQIALSFGGLLSPDTVDYQIFWELRFPRLVEAFFAGATLGLSGLLFQSIFRNPMSTPFTLGVASGATLGAAFAIVFVPASWYLFSVIPLFASIGALVTVVLLFTITARLSSHDTNSLLLVGIALSFFYSAALMVMFYISDQKQSYEIIRFTMGSVDIVGLTQALPIVVSSLVLLAIAFYYKGALKLLLTSYDNAFLKGINVKKTTTILLVSISIVVGICVSITGPIGFVGLIIPHILKNIYKQSADTLIFQTFFYAGVFLVFSDLISRNLGTTSNVPIGVITAFVGGPFFIYLIIKRKKV